jgi:nucleoside-diphosphate-sugar epimerase
MKIAVTGATGFIGARLLEQLDWHKHEVQALARRAMKPRRGVTWVTGALDQPGSLAQLVQGAEAIIHIAGVISGRTARDFDIPNVDGTRALIEAARAAGIRRFVHVSSLAAREPNVSLYGASKERSEEVVRGSGLDYAIVRPPAVYGPGDKETLELFKMAKRGVMLLPPKGRLSIIHADDLVRLFLALAQPGAPSAILIEPEDGSGGITHHQLAEALGRAVGRRPLALSLPSAVLRLGASIDQAVRRDRAKLTRDRAAYFCHPDWVANPALGAPGNVWRPTIPLADGLAETATWYREQAWL